MKIKIKQFYSELSRTEDNFFHIFHIKILTNTPGTGGNKFSASGDSRSGSKAKDGEKKGRKKKSESW